MTEKERVIQPDDSQPPSRERFGAQDSHRRGAGGPGDMNDEVGRLVRLADTSGSIATERIARVRTAVHGAWREENAARQARQVKSRRRWLTVAVSLCATAVIVIAFAIRGPIRTPPSLPASVLVAHVDHITGPATGSLAPFAAGDAVMSGSTVSTSNGTLALTLTSGVHLTLDASSTARVDSTIDVALERGAVYVDSADAHPGVYLSPGTPAPRLADASPISIHTTAGIVRDIGTQFEVRLAGAGMRTRVRNGQVRVTYVNGVDVRAGAGEELFSKLDGSDRSISRRPIAVTGGEWAWAERAAPPFAVEGQTLGALLDWVSREGAWTVTFVDTRFSATARAAVLHGGPDLLKGLTPAEALDVVLPTCGLRYRLDHDRVVIERETVKGATR